MSCDDGDSNTIQDMTMIVRNPQIKETPLVEVGEISHGLILTFNNHIVQFPDYNNAIQRDIWCLDSTVQMKTSWFETE